MKSVKGVLSVFFNKNRINGITRLHDQVVKTFLDNISKGDFPYTGKENEEMYRKKWAPLYKKVSPLWYEAYARISGKPDINYVPHNVYYAIIEPILNNFYYSTLYEEKNTYDMFFKDKKMPETFLRSSDSVCYSEDYQTQKITDENLYLYLKGDKIIIKPTTDTGGGKNIDVFHRRGDYWKRDEGDQLTVSYLQNQFGGNFIIQEYLPQSEYIGQFNPDSVNTFRIYTYRSVKSNEINVLSATLRIGVKGSYIDNANAGGAFCGVDLKTGLLTKYAMSKEGIRYSEYNGVNFNNDYRIEQIEQIKQFAIGVAERCLHHRVLSSDIMLDKNNEIRLIEINARCQGVFVNQQVNGPLFKGYTDEVIAYCLQNYRHFMQHYTLQL